MVLVGLIMIELGLLLVLFGLLFGLIMVSVGLLLILVGLIFNKLGFF